MCVESKFGPVAPIPQMPATSIVPKATVIMIGCCCEPCKVAGVSRALWAMTANKPAGGETHELSLVLAVESKCGICWRYLGRYRTPKLGLSSRRIGQSRFLLVSYCRR